MEIQQEEVPAPPPLSLDATDELSPRPPFFWIRESLSRGFGGDTLTLMVAWMAFTGISGAAWAWHLRNLSGWSALPNHWGDRLTARDVWELAVNGGWERNPIGSITAVLACLTMIWVLWAGWRLQARTVDLPSRLGPWVWGLLDALLLAPSLLLPLVGALAALEWLGNTGIQGLGWLALVGTPLLQATTFSAFMLLWWFSRLGRAQGLRGGIRGYGRHLGRGFLRLWMHPVQWFLLLFGSATLRALLGFGALLIGWRWGGGTTARVWSLLIMELIAAALGAWILGALLRLCALFWRHDDLVRDVRKQLKEAFPGERVLDQS